MSYYNFLCKINQCVCDNSETRANTKQYFNIIDNAINKTLYTSKNDEEILINAMQVAALIKLFQPFYDANHKTGLITFGYLITQKGFLFDFQEALNDMKNKKLNIPTIYEETDTIGNFNKWYKYIKKQQNKTLKKD